MTGPYTLTVGDLRKKLEGLPDDMPIAYQRIEDVYFNTHNWTAISLLWERDKHAGDLMSDYIHAFSAYKHPHENIFVINAHY